jgi:hypothetical protein
MGLIIGCGNRSNAGIDTVTLLRVHDLEYNVSMVIYLEGND